MKVLHADEGMGSQSHPIDVEPISDPPDERLGERRSAERDLIEVTTGDGVMARVETMRHDQCRQDIDVRRQILIQLSQENLARQRRADVEMRDLRQRVNARIRSASSVELEVLAAGHRANSPIDFALDRPCILLNLPAAVARAGVLDRELEARHGLIVGSKVVISMSATSTVNSPVVVSLVPSLLPIIPTLPLSTEPRTG
jgi:hypothetical protein